MKNFLLRLRRFGLIALFAFTALTCVNAAEKVKPAGASPNFELSWTRTNTAGLQAAHVKLKRFEDTFKKGGFSKEDVDMVRAETEDIERQTPYALTIQSKGGTLKEFIATMSASDEIGMTVINAGEAQDLDTPIPPFSLRNANWGTVIEVMGNFLATRGLQLKLAGSERPDLLSSSSVVCVLRRAGPDQRPATTPTPQFESFAVGDYLAEQSIDDIVGAIRAAWELDPTHDKDALKLKFHQPTSILLASGPPQATFIAGKIISQLKRAPKIVKTTTPGEPAPEAKKE